ncbi:protein of unknown function [Methylorubrum extorquens]|jgi:hypothetical protein|uniref:Uncharacterized protein n=1 Tax=Methylorubrum extorquens TaxID=408 RepID=A0A2N9AMT5_METEX|nr:protein of unknown function [Methylorubrum extorquens]
MHRNAAATSQDPPMIGFRCIFYGLESTLVSKMIILEAL